MQTPPTGVGVDDLRRALREHWDVDATALDHLPLGFGSHHWAASGSDRHRRFVTVDVLSAPGGPAMLDAAFRTAYVLQQEARLEFVVAPLPTTSGEVLQRLADDVVVSVWPWLDLLDPPAAQTSDAVDQVEAVALLARLHDATAFVAGVARLDDLAIDERSHLDARLADPTAPWADGPYSAKAKALLDEHHGAVLAALRTYDRLAAAAAQDPRSWVVTHGEPHPGNLLRTARGLVLVDWDTVLVAPAARDLWAAGGRDDATPAYVELTGRAVPDQEVELYALRWELTDTSLYVRWFADPHADDEDSSTAWDALQEELGKLAARAG